MVDIVQCHTIRKATMADLYSLFVKKMKTKNDWFDVKKLARELPRINSFNFQICEAEKRNFVA